MGDSSSLNEVITPAMTTNSRIQYHIVPPSRFFSCESEKSDDEVNGAITRIVHATVWAMPLIAPSEDFEGDTSLKMTSMAPGKP